MLLNTLNLFLKHSPISLFLAVVFSLTACGGGGGGGGGGTLSKKVSIVFPADGNTVSDSSAAFQIAFASDSVDTSSLVITLNGIDVTALFDPVTGTANRTASVYSLSGILVDGTENFFNAQVTGSSVAGVQFTYDAKPEIILTSLTGAGFDTVNGLTRKATLTSVSVNDLLATIASGKTFSLASVILPSPSTSTAPTTTTPDFTIVATDADGDSQTTTFIVPKATVKYGAAVQLNNSAFNVIEKWVSELMVSKIDTFFAEFEANPHPAPVDLAVYDDIVTASLSSLLDSRVAGDETTACQFVNFVASAAQTNCRLFVSDITATGTITTDVKVLDSGSSTDDTFPVEVTVSIPQLSATIDNVAFNDSTTFSSATYVGALISTLNFSSVELTFTVNLSKATGKIVQLSLPVAPYSLTLGLATATGSNCNICGSSSAASMNNTLSLLGSAGVTTLQTTIVDTLISSTFDLPPGYPGVSLDPTKFNTVPDSLGQQMESILASTTVSDTTLSYPVKNAADVQISTLNFALSGSVVNEAKSTPASTTVAGGFIGLGGSTYSDGGNDIPALGSYFDPLDVASEVNKNFINATDDVMIALSENSLNQLLLAVYQSRSAGAQALTLKVSELGDLGTQIITSSAPFAAVGYDIDADDDVEIIVDLEAIPNAEFITGATESGFQLNLYAVRVIVRLYRDGSTTPIGSVADTVNMLVDVKALLNYGLDAETSLPFASIDKGNVVLDVQSLTSFQNLLTRQQVLEVFPEFLGTYIQDSVAVLNEPIVRNVDLSGLGLVDKSSWLVLQALTVDAKNEFIMLRATVVDVEPALPKQGIFRLNVTDCTASPASAFCP